MANFRIVLLLFGLYLSGIVVAQPADFERKGFFWGAAAGGSYLRLQVGGSSAFSGGGGSFPNLRFGIMLGPRTAVVVLLPGTVYAWSQSGRTRDRGFEGMVPMLQYWPANRWWVSAGVGVGMDAPAFYDIKDSTERKFWFGGGAVAATGWELLQREHFVLDLQARVHTNWGIKNPLATEKGTAVSVLVGVTWY